MPCAGCLTTFRGNGLRPGVDLDNTAALYNLMDTAETRLLDVLVYAHREDAPRHDEHIAWLRELLVSAEPFGVTSLVLTGFVRVVTHRRVFDPPSPLTTALAFGDDLRGHDNFVSFEPSARHWQIFKEQCAQADARGNLVTDAHLAAGDRDRQRVHHC